MPEPYYSRAGIVIYHGDCREILPTLEPASVDACITDPPYGRAIAEWDATVPYDLVPDLLTLIRGPLLWFGSAKGLAQDVASFPVSPERTVIWHVTFSLGKTAANGMFYRWHPIHCWRLPKKQAGLNQDIIGIATDGHNGWYHPGTKPLKLLARLVEFCEPGGIVLDPFLGSGTTLVAALQSGRQGIGIEIEERYCEIAARRLEQAALPLEAVNA